MILPDPRRCMRLNERRQAQAAADLADEHVPLGSGVMTFMRGTPWLCKAVGLDLDRPLADDDVAAMVDWFRAREVPPTVELTAYSAPGTLASLARAGFALADVEHVLSRRPAGLPVVLPDDVTIVPLDRSDEAAMRRHAEIVCGGFVPPGGAVPEPVLESSIRSQRHPNARGFFAAREDGTPVAASGMEVSAIRQSEGEAPTTVVALWGTTVLPEHRRRGIQQAFIAQRVRVGHEAGAELAVIESKPGIPTERNAARLGFALTYTRLILRAP